MSLMLVTKAASVLSTIVAQRSESPTVKQTAIPRTCRPAASKVFVDCPRTLRTEKKMHDGSLPALYANACYIGRWSTSFVQAGAGIDVGFFKRANADFARAAQQKYVRMYGRSSLVVRGDADPRRAWLSVRQSGLGFVLRGFYAEPAESTYTRLMTTRTIAP